VARGQPLIVITDTQDPFFQLLDVSGKVVYQIEFSGTSDLLYFDTLVPGLYLYRIMTGEDLISTGRVVLVD